MADPCINQHAIDMLETDRDNIVERLNLVIAGQGEMKQQVAVLTERVPADLKEKLSNIQNAVDAHNKFRGHVNQFIMAVFVAIGLAFVAWVVSGGMRVVR